MDRMDHHSPPSPGWLKLNVDGSVDGSKGFARAGGDFSFTMYLYKGLFLIMCLYRDLLFITCLNRGLLSCLFFFKSIKICLCTPLSGNYVFESIGFPRFKSVLDSFTNCPTRTSIRARIFKNLNVWLRHFLY